MADKHEAKNQVGRPSKFSSVEELQDLIDGYFGECKDHKSTIITKDGKTVIFDDPIIPTIAGLAYHLNTDRHTIYNYAAKDEYFHTIKRAREYIISQIESKMANVNGNIVGTIFLAKNYGYTDKQEIEMTKPLEVVITDYCGKKNKENLNGNG
jgi:hypothetical protein